MELCPECGSRMIRRKSKFGNNHWWGCSQWPKCGVTFSEHPNGKVMSLPAGEEIKKLRKLAHQALETIWRYHDKKEKNKMYAWLKRNTQSGHIGLMDQDELIDLLGKLAKKAKYHKIRAT